MPVFKIVIRKSERRLELFEGEDLRKAYPIALGSCPLGSKEVEGDGKTPEGEYYVFTKNPESKFRLSLAISYPSPVDAEIGLAKGLITVEEYSELIAAGNSFARPPQKTRLGGEIYIHGGGIEGDWTEGCIALSDDDISELFSVVERGTRVEIYP
jgi:murein L,D-transpeptidase YafK